MLLLLLLSAPVCLLLTRYLLLLALLAVTHQQPRLAAQCRTRWSGRVAAAAGLRTK
jgi:hypothetical protein